MASVLIGCLILAVYNFAVAITESVFLLKSLNGNGDDGKWIAVATCCIYHYITTLFMCWIMTKYPFNTEEEGIPFIYIFTVYGLFSIVVYISAIVVTQKIHSSSESSDDLIDTSLNIEIYTWISVAILSGFIIVIFLCSLCYNILLRRGYTSIYRTGDV